MNYSDFGTYLNLCEECISNINFALEQKDYACSHAPAFFPTGDLELFFVSFGVIGKGFVFPVAVAVGFHFSLQGVFAEEAHDQADGGDNQVEHQDQNHTGVKPGEGLRKFHPSPEQGIQHGRKKQSGKDKENSHGQRIDVIRFALVIEQAGNQGEDHPKGQAEIPHFFPVGVLVRLHSGREVNRVRIRSASLCLLLMVSGLFCLTGNSRGPGSPSRSA